MKLLLGGHLDATAATATGQFGHPQASDCTLQRPLKLGTLDI
jgi:hypothetical protein